MKPIRIIAIFVGLLFAAGTVHAQATRASTSRASGWWVPDPLRAGRLFNNSLRRSQGSCRRLSGEAPLQMNLQLGPSFPCLCGTGATTLCPAVIPCVAQANGAAKSAAKKPSLQAQGLRFSNRLNHSAGAATTAR